MTNGLPQQTLDAVTVDVIGATTLSDPHVHVAVRMGDADGFLLLVSGTLPGETHSSAVFLRFATDDLALAFGQKIVTEVPQRRAAVTPPAGLRPVPGPVEDPKVEAEVISTGGAPGW